MSFVTTIDCAYMSSRSSRRPSSDQLFTFVVVADTHTNQAEDESTSPLPKNVTIGLQVELIAGEEARVWAQGTDSIEAWQCVFSHP